MKVKHHIYLGFIFAGFLYWLIPEIKFVGFITILLSSVLIDIDHYLPSDSENSGKKAYLFHGIEYVTLFTIWSFVEPIMGFIAIGFTFHIICDCLYNLNKCNRIERLSYVYDAVRKK